MDNLLLLNFQRKGHRKQNHSYVTPNNNQLIAK